MFLMIKHNIRLFKGLGAVIKARQMKGLMEQLKNVGESVGMFIWLMDRDMNIEFLDVKAPMDMVSRSFTKESRERLLYCLSDAAIGKTMEVDVELDQRFTFKHRYMRFYIYRNTSPDSKYIAYGKVIGIDEVKKHQEALMEAYKVEEEVALKESFLASMGHEIRTPLNAIVGFLQMIIASKDSASKEELQEYSTIIKDNTEQLLELLERTIDVKNNGQPLDPPLSRKSVGEIMEDLYNTHLVIIPHKLDFVISRGPELYVMTNRSFFLQIVSNLLCNAIKFTRQGSITMGWEERDGKAVIFIEDTGDGIPEDKIEQIFKPYYKTDSSSAGAGIGLQLCRQLATMMNSEIKVSSTLGKGSRFELIIPEC